MQCLCSALAQCGNLRPGRIIMCLYLKHGRAGSKGCFCAGLRVRYVWGCSWSREADDKRSAQADGQVNWSAQLVSTHLITGLWYMPSRVLGCRLPHADSLVKMGKKTARSGCDVWRLLQVLRKGFWSSGRSVCRI
jgi:hypothetical protein